jgi:hypothetical protein
MLFLYNMFQLFVTYNYAECNILGGKGGIHLTYTKDGRPSGEAYINLASEDDVAKALAKDKHHMGRRYIEGTFFAVENN